MTTATATMKARRRLPAGRAPAPRSSPDVGLVAAPASPASTRSAAAAASRRGRAAQLRMMLREVAIVLLLGQLAS